MTPAEQIRSARGPLSRAEAARRTGIPLRTLEDWEAGTRTPRPYTLRSVVQSLESIRQDVGTESTGPCADYRPHEGLAGLNGESFCICGFEQRQHR